MKSQCRLFWVSLVLAFPALSGSHAAGLQKATVTRITNKVELIQPNSQPRAAAIGNSLQGDTGVQTGPKSLAELTFLDHTLARLGSNTLFSFDSGTRSVELESGTMLLQVPKGAGGAKIKTAPVTAAITGTTVLVEFSPNGKGIVKLIVIEGSVRLSLNNRAGESIVVTAGHEVTLSGDATSLPEPQAVDLKRIMETSKLITAGPLGNTEEITSELEAQQVLKEKGVLVEVNFDPQPNRDPAQIVSNAQAAIQNQTTVVNNAPPPPPPPPPPTPPPTPLPTPEAKPEPSIPR